MGWGQNPAKQLPAKQAPGSELGLISRSLQLQGLRLSILSELQGGTTVLLSVNAQLSHEKKSSEKAVTTSNRSTVVIKYNCIQIASRPAICPCICQNWCLCSGNARASPCHRLPRELKWRGEQWRETCYMSSHPAKLSDSPRASGSVCCLFQVMIDVLASTVQIWVSKYMYEWGNVFGGVVIINYFLYCT